MDAVMEARAGVGDKLKAQWQDTQALIKSYSALGGDPASIVPAFSGTARPVTARSTSRGRATTTRSRGSTATRRRSNGNGGSGGTATTPTVTAEQFVGYLTETGGATVSQLAAHFGVSGQTIRRYGKRWASKIDTSGATWKAKAAS